ncbi:MAG: DUF4349 domain-containing protein [Roseiflexaceae bacterium]
MKTFHSLLILFALLAALLLNACAGAPDQTFAPVSAGLPASPPQAAPPASGGSVAFDAEEAAKASESTVANPQANPASQPSDVQRLVIKTAQLTLEVEDVTAAEAAIRSKVAELQGYIVSSQTSGSTPDLYVQITFRVPSAQFETALSGVQGIAKRVLNRSLGGEDVTEEFVDLESRMRNLEATSERLLALLEKSESVEEALAVNQALTQVQGEIELIQGRMKYLQQSAAMSTITVALQPVPRTPIIADEGWDPLQAGRRALSSLIEFGQGLVELAIVLLIWSPVWVPTLLFVRWIWRKLFGKRKPASEPAPPPTA